MIIAGETFTAQHQSSTGQRILRAIDTIEGADAVVTIAVDDPGVTVPCIWAVYWSYGPLVPIGGSLKIEFATSGIYFNTDIVIAGKGRVEFFGDIMKGSAATDAVTITLADGTVPGQQGYLVVTYSHELLEEV